MSTDERTERDPSPPDDAADAPRRGRLRRALGLSRLPVWGEALVLLAAAVVLAVVVTQLFVQTFSIPSASMEPGLVKGDRIAVEKPSYWGGGTPQRGDVVVFDDPGHWLGTSDDDTGPVGTLLSTVGLYPDGGHLVKRVIGVGGDTVTCCDKEGRIEVNGVALDEDDYIAPRRENQQCNGPMQPLCQWSSGVVPEGELFVMGDNRDSSDDSSYHLCLDTETDCTDDPFVDEDLVVGKVVAVVWPVGRVQGVGRPDVFDRVPDPGGD